jgi:hypothetical protein
VKHDSAIEEIVARRVAGETLSDIRTVRREMREPGSVRGLKGQCIRTAIARYRRAESNPPPRAAS